MKVVRSISISEEIDKELRERYSEANVSILCEQALGEYVSMRERAEASRSANTHDKMFSDPSVKTMDRKERTRGHDHLDVLPRVEAKR